MKRIAIVGNAPVEEDFGPVVDSCDTVIRFNYCGNFGWGTGVKIDILALANTGGSGERMCRNTHIKQLTIFRKSSEIWFVQGVPPWWQQVFFRKERKDYSRRIVRRLALEEKQLLTVSASTVQAVQATLAEWGAPAKNMPSSGVMTIYQVLHLPRFEGAEILLFGFTSKGNPMHSWDAEKQWLASLADEGRVKMIDRLEAAS